RASAYRPRTARLLPRVVRRVAQSGRRLTATWRWWMASSCRPRLDTAQARKKRVPGEIGSMSTARREDSTPSSIRLAEPRANASGRGPSAAGGGRAAAGGKERTAAARGNGAGGAPRGVGLAKKPRE